MVSLCQDVRYFGPLLIVTCAKKDTQTNGFDLHVFFLEPQSGVEIKDIHNNPVLDSKGNPIKRNRLIVRHHDTVKNFIDASIIAPEKINFPIFLQPIHIKTLTFYGERGIEDERKWIFRQRILIYQCTYPELPEKTTNKVMIVDCTVDYKKRDLEERFQFEVQAENIENWPGGFQDVSFAGKDEIYAQESNSRKIKHCTIDFNSKSASCKPGFEVVENSMSGFNIHFDRRFDVVTLYAVSDSEIKICSKKNEPDKSPIDLKSSSTTCQVQKIYFTEFQKVDLMSGYIRLGRTFTVMLVSYYSKSKSRLSSLAGYLRVDLTNQASQYHDLSNWNARDISFVNKTFYILHKDPSMILRRISTDLVFLKASRQVEKYSASVSRFVPNLNEEPKAVTTTVVSLKDERAGISIAQVSNQTVFL